MQILFTTRFEKDIRKLKDKKIAANIEEIILAVKIASGIADIHSLKKLKGFQNAYRIKIGDYRIGLFISGNTAEFACFMNRKDIYKFFP